MQTKTLRERIEKLEKEFYSEYPHAKLSLNIQVKEASDVADLVVEMFGLVDDLVVEIFGLKELNAISYDANARLSKENEALLAKNKELEEKLKNNLEETEEVQIQKDDFAKEGFDKTVQTLWYSCQRCDKKFKIKKIGGEVT
jgi:hypothetical protein